MPDKPDPEQNPILGITLKVMSVAVFMVMSVAIKATAPHIPAGEAVFFRSSFAMVPILAWLFIQGQLAGSFRTNNPVGHFWRGIVGTSGMFCGFMALGLIPLPEAVTIGYAAPLLATILAAIFLGERLRAYRMTAVLVGLAGVVIILGQKFSLLDQGEAGAVEALGAAMALAGALFAAMATILVRKLVTEERTTTIVLYFSLTASLLGLLTFPFGWVVPTPKEAALLVGAGFLGGIGQILLTASYRHAETSVIAPFEYTSILMALAAGYFLFDEVPTGAMLTGAVLVILAGLFIVLREHQLGLERKRARKAMTPQG